jgi:hypothetical protein
LKKYFLFWIPPVLFTLEVVLSHPPVNEGLADQLGTSSGEVVFWSGVVLIALFICQHYVQVVRPYQKYRRLEITKRNILDLQAQTIIGKYQHEHGIEVRLNLMTVKRVWISNAQNRDDQSQIVPWKIWQRHLEIFWRSETMRHSSDANIRLHVDQGVAGEAFRKEEGVIADMTQQAAENYNLNDDQIEKSEDLRFIYSFPVRKLDPETNRITAKVIGVVNIDSVEERAEELIQNEETLKRLTQEVTAFSEICSQIL